MIREDTIQSFDIFFRSTDGKMVLYSAGGERVEQDVLDKIHECNIDISTSTARTVMDTDSILKRTSKASSPIPR